MEQSTVKIGLERLQKNFGRTYGAESVRLMADELKGEPDECMKPAVEKLLLESSILPTPAKLIALVRDHASTMREQEASDGKRRETGISKVEAATNYGRDAIQLMLAHLSGTVKKREYLKGCFRVMDTHNVRDDELTAYVSEEWKKLPPEEKAA